MVELSIETKVVHRILEEANPHGLWPPIHKMSN